MHKIIKSGTIVSSEEQVDIPDYIPPVAPAIELSDIDMSGIDDETLKEKCTQIIENARIQSEEISQHILAEAQNQKQQLIQKANEEARAIIEDAKDEAQSIINEAEDEAESIRTDAYNEGCENGISEKRAEVERILEEMNSTLEEMKSVQNDYFKRYADELKYLAIEIAEKITMNKLEEDDKFLLRLIVQNVKSIRDADWITIEISEKLGQLSSDIENAMHSSGLSKKTEVQLMPDMKKDDCILKATDRIVDISLSTQFSNVKAYFEKCDETDD